MTWQLVPLAGAAAQAWRNGGGLTRELLAWPSPDAWQVRISVADVTAAGPFSTFEGIERWFAVLEGAGVVLRVDGVAKTLVAGDAPFHFSGEARVDCALVDGSTRDFNLMARPGRSRLHRVAGERAFRLQGEMLAAVYAHGRPAAVRTADSVIEVPAGHLAWCRRQWAASGTVTGADALWMEIEG